MGLLGILQKFYDVLEYLNLGILWAIELGLFGYSSDISIYFLLHLQLPSVTRRRRLVGGSLVLTLESKISYLDVFKKYVELNLECQMMF